MRCRRCSRWPLAQEMQSALKRKGTVCRKGVTPCGSTDQQIEETYRLIEQHHQEFLVSQGVRLPRLRQAGQYTKYALTLVYQRSVTPIPAPSAKRNSPSLFGSTTRM